MDMALEETPVSGCVCTIGKIGKLGHDGLYVHSVIRGVMCGGELGSVLTNHRLVLCSAGTTSYHCTALQGYKRSRSTVTAVTFYGHLRQILRLIVLSLQV